MKANISSPQVLGEQNNGNQENKALNETQKNVSLVRADGCYLFKTLSKQGLLISQIFDGILPQAYFFSVISKGWKQVIVVLQTERKRLGCYRSRTS